MYIPILPGSGANTPSEAISGMGGGFIWIEALGTVDVNGLFTARGGNGNVGLGYGPGGAGGAILIICRNFQGGAAGQLVASGGGGYYSGGGGGGRIAVWYSSSGRLVPRVLLDRVQATTNLPSQTYVSTNLPSSFLGMSSVDGGSSANGNNGTNGTCFFIQYDLCNGTFFVIK